MRTQIVGRDTASTSICREFNIGAFADIQAAPRRLTCWWGEDSRLLLRLKALFVFSWVSGVIYWTVLFGLTLWLTRAEQPTPRLVLLGIEMLALPVGIFVAKVTHTRFLADVRNKAYRDELTGLANRSYFMERLTDALARSQRRQGHVSVLFLDFDGFKRLNDTMGHPAGDQLLKEAAARFAGTVRGGEMAARLGGDEFTFVLEDLREREGAEALATRILTLLEQPFSIDGHEVVMSASVGVAFNDGPYCSADELVRRADVALYQAKADGRNCYRIFTPRSRESNFKSLELGAGLRAAIDHGELRLDFQPEIDLTSGAIVGFEALVRWQHPRQGLLQPLEFVPTAEEFGMIRDVGKWVLRESCKEAQSWARTHPHLANSMISVNVSPLEFRARDFVDEINAALNESGLLPQRLKLEIVETALMSDLDSTTATLHSLKELGVKLAIDDFGTGYSSLSYLRRFPIDTLKIDQSFVRQAPGDRKVQSIIKAMVQLSHALDMDVTAEGIETREQLSLLMEAKCDRAQGFLFSRPIARDAVLHYLTAQEKAAEKAA
ncbi:MAG TPA: bifunctional diguanylate cyclase/phosphodiesterase [Dehalococcoidia bacterium]|nr:bifunctional diguanylate cyclase/phosphodiesterase [Dehalococcoidia bacterium]